MTLLFGQAIQFISVNAWMSYDEKINGGVGGITSLLFPLFSFIFVVSMAYLVAKIVALRTNKYHAHKNFDIIDQFHLDRQTKITIINIAGQVYILGRTENSIQVIDTLDDTRKCEVMGQKQNDKSFKTYLQTQLNDNKHHVIGRLLKKMGRERPFSLWKSKPNSKISRFDQENSKDDRNEMD